MLCLHNPSRLVSALKFARRGGAVKRSCLEPDEDPINLDSVVEDLDPGDSFVTTIVDILVKYVRSHQNN
jgi:hypothetical protein